MSQDRAQADQFAVTSVFLTYMLGEPGPAIASAGLPAVTVFSQGAEEPGSGRAIHE